MVLAGPLKGLNVTNHERNDVCQQEEAAVAQLAEVQQQAVSHF
jgi:hypothetical protein